MPDQPQSVPVLGPRVVRGSKRDSQNFWSWFSVSFFSCSRQRLLTPAAATARCSTHSSHGAMIFTIAAGQTHYRTARSVSWLQSVVSPIALRHTTHIHLHTYTEHKCSERWWKRMKERLSGEMTGAHTRRAVRVILRFAMRSHCYGDDNVL